MSEVSVGVVPDEQDAVPQSRPKSSVFPVLKRWLREPLLHFLLLGVAAVRGLRLHAAWPRRSRVVEADRAEPR